MCGIVGYLGHRESVPILLDGLKRLEYRGYDSAGIAVINGHGVSIHRSEGKLERLITKINGKHPSARIGIGHTRWATHGRPSEINAHPHAYGRVVVVHNGIIENYRALKESLPGKGANFKSETDTEVICHVIQNAIDRGLPFGEAFSRTLNELEGSFALVSMDTQSPDTLYMARKGSPLVTGLGENGYFIASDIPALLPYTRKVIFLNDGEYGVCNGKGITFFNKKQKPVKKSPREIHWSAEMAEKGGYKHFMLKEIMEQPNAVADTLLGRINKNKNEIDLGEIKSLFKGLSLKSFRRFYIVACGTSYHAAMVGRYYIEAIAKMPVSVDTASEFRYREPFIDKKTLLVVISQSGETADTLACVQEARRKGARVMSVCNVIDSSIARLTHANLYTHAGLEIGVASTKAFTTQLVVLLMLALYLGRKNKELSAGYVRRATQQLLALPNMMDSLLAQGNAMARIARSYVKKHNFYFIARGVHFPIALEGALKLKEISYIHAEGYSAGEMKHGPIALIEPGTPVLAIATQDRVCSKMISNIEEVQARGASVTVIATEGDTRFAGKCDHVFYVPKTLWYLTPILVTLPLQLLAYTMADMRHCDVDQPRNLAKSVTVE